MTNDDGDENEGPDVYPTEDELPDEPATVDDIDPFIVDDESFDSIDNWARAEWLAQRRRATNEDEGKDPHPEGVEATEGWPDDDVELPYDDSGDPEEWKEPYPEDIDVPDEPADDRRED
jgi:hypothetical protein